MTRIVATGFYGQYNLGDEAFCFVLRDAGIATKFTAGAIAQDATHVIVGGGEFEPWMVRRAPTDAKLYAVGIGLVRDKVGEERASWLRRFEYVAVRTLACQKLASEWGIRSVLRSDLALLLAPNTSYAERFKDRDVIVPRIGVPIESAPTFGSPVVIPFWPYDMNTTCPYEVFDPKNDPRVALSALIGAKRVFHYGKLHAKVFAYTAGVEDVDLAPDDKTRAFSEMTNRFSRYALTALARVSIENLRTRIGLR